MKETAILFGHGNVFERKIGSLKGKYEIVAILDNNTEGNETDTETGLVIRKPEGIKDICSDKVILLSYSLGDMAAQMISLGVEHDRIIYGIFENPKNSFEDMLFDEGNGELHIGVDGLWYKNSRLNWSAKVDSRDIRSINADIKGTLLYPNAEPLIAAFPAHPLDDDYGANRGTPVDRYYIERFLETYSDLIKGKVLEIGGRDYTERYGGDNVAESDVIHKKVADPENRIFKGDLVTGEGLSDDLYDCFICTQTLPFIFDIKSATKNIIKVLKPGGVALITAGGISQIITNDRRRYGHYWSFTDMSLERLFLEEENISQIKVVTYGNVKSASAFLYGLSWEELGREALDLYDPEYQVIVAAVVQKAQ